MNHIITISRAFGSAGAEIGEKLAARFGVKYYDKELLKRASEESGMCHEIFENHDEKPTNSFLYNLVMDTYSFGYGASPYVEMPISHKVFLAQFDAIKNIAKEGPCVIVGRCADYALSEFDNVLNVYIHAPLEKRIDRISKKYDLTKEKARDMIIKKDKQRANYYNYYSSKKWGKADTYHVCIDSSLLGIEGTVNALYSLIDSIEA
ncbi:MAG: cytidylate kinase-like family protein [Lachnospiraceae bacterium]|nr:cytidylate kinase-like family protein [Lachnospiraceae bacterium]